MKEEKFVDDKMINDLVDVRRKSIYCYLTAFGSLVLLVFSSYKMTNAENVLPYFFVLCFSVFALSAFFVLLKNTLPMQKNTNAMLAIIKAVKSGKLDVAEAICEKNKKSDMVKQFYEEIVKDSERA